MSLDTHRGQRQIGNYDLLDLIAEGGMGAVYKGRNRATGEVVAIKIIPPETARNPLMLKRFEQEFRAASLLDHPNVVKALDYCGTGPTPFLVMEYVDGESLGQRTERDGAIPEAEAVRLIGQACEGLHRAHKQGLVHRDIKPDNILVTADGTAKVTDLGLVKDMEGEMNLTRTGRGLGTPHFMAPEQFRNAKAADVRCDVYSLGATLYAMVTGVTPFANTSPLDCWMKKTKNDFPEPRALNPDVGERVNWAICRAMSNDPANRPVSCREFMEDLTGTGWRTGSGAVAGSGAPADLWYMVYRDETGQSKTVKGTTDSIRRNLAAGTLGDPALIVVSRTKNGQFVPLRNAPEFRDLIVASPSSAHLKAPPSGRMPVSPPAGTPQELPRVPRPTPPAATIPTPPAGAADPTAAMPPARGSGTAYHPVSRDTLAGHGDTTGPISAPLPRDLEPDPKGFDWAPVLLIAIALLAAATGVVLFMR